MLQHYPGGLYAAYVLTVEKFVELNYDSALITFFCVKILK